MAGITNATAHRYIDEGSKGVQAYAQLATALASKKSSDKELLALFEAAVESPHGAVAAQEFREWYNTISTKELDPEVRERAQTLSKEIEFLARRG